MTKLISHRLHGVWQLALSCAGGLLLVLASASYAADTPAGATVNPTPEAAASSPTDAAVNPAPEVAANPPADAAVNPTPEAAAKPPFEAASDPQLPVVNDPQSVYRIKENPFFDLHIDKSLGHARAAEIAGNMGQTAELLEQAQMSLMRAKEAQRAGNVPGLNEGIANLRKALKLPIWLTQGSASPTTAQDIDPQCINEFERQCGEVQQGSGRLQKCFDDKIDNFSPMCQEKLKEGKAAIAAAILGNRHEKQLTGTPREEAAVRSATDSIREARKNLSQAAGKKYVEIKPQRVAAVPSER